MENSFENKERVPVVETVRVALFHRDKFLILQKTTDSKNPDALEFPGGKIDEIANNSSNEEEQKDAAYKELLEETGVDAENIKGAKIEKVESFEVYFETIDKENPQTTKRYKRLVHLYLIQIPNEEELTVKTNETKNEEGASEDKHKEEFAWLTPEELITNATKIPDEDTSPTRTIPLARNSRHIKKLLQAIQD